MHDLKIIILLYTQFLTIYILILIQKSNTKTLNIKICSDIAKRSNYHRLERVFDSLIKSTGIKLTHNNTFTQNKSCFTDIKF